jgi:hypothetical protein
MHAQVSIASTDEVDSRDRLAYWEDYNARQLVGLRCSTYHDDGLRAREMNVDLGALRLADIVGNSHVVDRSSQHVAQTPKRSVFVTHLLSGQAFFVHADGCLRLGPGDTLVYDASRPYLFGFETEMHQVMLDLPHDALGGHTGPGALPERGAVVVAGAGSRTLAALMRATVVTSARGDSLSRSAASERLLAAAVAVIRPDDAPQEALRNVARNEIRRRLRDPRCRRRRWRGPSACPRGTSIGSSPPMAPPSPG